MKKKLNELNKKLGEKKIIGFFSLFFWESGKIYFTFPVINYRISMYLKYLGR